MFDSDHTGYLSLAKIDEAMRDLLPALFEIKPVLIRAFEAAKKKSKKHSKDSHDFVDVTDFRWLLKYIHIYYEIYVLFD